eukprot:10064332-Alexandrium_andersonii.AAC.1
MTLICRQSKLRALAPTTCRPSDGSQRAQGMTSHEACSALAEARQRHPSDDTSGSQLRDSSAFGCFKRLKAL